MRAYFLPIFILLLFFCSSVFLTVRQNILFSAADQALVAMAFVEPGNKDDARFFISHHANSPRALTIEYLANNQVVQTESLTLNPKEKLVVSAPSPDTTITVRYQTADNQEQSLTLYKK